MQSVGLGLAVRGAMMQPAAGTGKFNLGQARWPEAVTESLNCSLFLTSILDGINSRGPHPPASPSKTVRSLAMSLPRQI